MTVLIHGYKLVLTSVETPEQYDVYNSDGEVVAYMKLRWGSFVVRCPECMGDVAFHQELESFGKFSTNIERHVILTRGIEAVQKYYLAKQIENWG